MDLEPRTLGIPLERPDRLGAGLIGACVATTVALGWHDPVLGLAFALAAGVALPVLWLVVRIGRGTGARAFGVARCAGLVAGLAIAKAALLPRLLDVLVPLLVR